MIFLKVLRKVVSGNFEILLNVDIRKFDKEFEAKRSHSRGCMLF